MQWKRHWKLPREEVRTVILFVFQQNVPPSIEMYSQLIAASHGGATTVQRVRQFCRHSRMAEGAFIMTGTRGGGSESSVNGMTEFGPLQ